MVDQFEDRVGIVTGAGTEIGRATALAFAGRGATVVLSDLDRDAGEETQRAIRGIGREAVFVSADAAKASEAADLVEQAVGRYGRLDFAFNNVGNQSVLRPMAVCSDVRWRQPLALDLNGAWNCMQCEVGAMLKRGGAIVNVVSTSGLEAFRNLPVYLASDHGVVGMTKKAAREYGTNNVRINAIYTDGLPAFKRRLLRNAKSCQASLIDAILWLCADTTRLSGEALVIDGGVVSSG